MAEFHALLPALNQGQSVRRGDWEPVIRMFVLREILMCQSGTSRPWNHALGWEEITAKDWQLAEFPIKEVIVPATVAAPTWRIVQNNGSRAFLAANELKKEIRRPKRMTRRGFFCLLTPGALIEEEALGTLFRLWL